MGGLAPSRNHVYVEYMANVTTESFDLTKKKLHGLAKHEGGPALTLYMPLQTPSAKSAGKQENMIRLKNLIKKAEVAGESYARPDSGTEAETVSSLLNPLRDALHGGDRFWDPQAESVAIFITSEMLRVVPLPVTVAEQAIVDDRFHLKPLFAARPVSGRFYLLALDMHNVHLYRGNAAKLQEVPLTGDPPELPDVLKEFSFERTLNRAPGTSTVYVGHAGGEENLSPHIVEFIEGIDEAVRRTIGESELKVILAGTENVVGHYRHRSKLSTLLDEYVHLSPRSATVPELHEKAWGIISRIQDEELRSEIDAVGGALESDQGVREVADICRDAYEGRLQILLIAQDDEVRGSYDPEGETVTYSDDGEDLLDLAAHYAWNRGTRVYAVSRERIPGGRPAAGVVHPT